MSWEDFGDPTTDYNAPPPSWVDDLGPIGAPGADSSGILNWLGQNYPSLLNGIAGIAGPVAGLVGGLASGGQTGSVNTTQNQNRSETGTTNETRSGFSNIAETRSGTTNETRNTSETGFDNRTPVLDPRANQTADRLNAALGGGFGTASQDLYGRALSMMGALAGGGGNAGAVVTPRAPSAMGAPSMGSPGAVNTTPTPAAVTGFPTRLPSELDQDLVNLIKGAFSGFTGDIAKSAIINARARGFAGGADLLQTAAAPIAGEALARMPAEQAKAYLEHVLQRYTAESENAARQNAANANALNAATNALQPGVQRYTADSNRMASQYGADSSRIGQQYSADVNRYLGELDANSKGFQNQISLLNAMMDPQNKWLNANLGLLNALPSGSNTMSGRTGTSSLSGATNTASVTNQVTGGSASGSSSNNSNATSNTNQVNSVPTGQVIANSLGDLFGGAGVGAAVMGNPANRTKSLLASLG